MKGQPFRSVPVLPALWAAQLPFFTGEPQDASCRLALRPVSLRHLTRRSPPSHLRLEEVVGDLDQAVLAWIVVAAAIAAGIERAVLGEHPVFTISQALRP